MSTSPSPGSPSKTPSLASKYRSPNCKPDEKPSTLFTFYAQNNKEASHELHSFMLSCQKHDYHTPDRMTLKNMKEVSSAALTKQHAQLVTPEDVKIDAHGMYLGIQGIEQSAAEISKRRMASNCAPHYNVNHVTAHNRFTCHYLGTGVDDEGKVVQNPFQTWKGTLASCDDGMKISDDVEADIRKLVWHAAGGEEAKLDVDKFICSINSIPMN